MPPVFVNISGRTGFLESSQSPSTVCLRYKKKTVMQRRILKKRKFVKNSEYTDFRRDGTLTRRLSLRSGEVAKDTIELMQMDVDALEDPGSLMEVDERFELVQNTLGSKDTGVTEADDGFRWLQDEGSLLELCERFRLTSLGDVPVITQNDTLAQTPPMLNSRLHQDQTSFVAPTPPRHQFVLPPLLPTVSVAPSSTSALVTIDEDEEGDDGGYTVALRMALEDEQLEREKGRAVEGKAYVRTGPASRTRRESPSAGTPCPRRTSIQRYAPYPRSPLPLHDSTRHERPTQRSRASLPPNALLPLAPSTRHNLPSIPLDPVDPATLPCGNGDDGAAPLRLGRSDAIDTPARRAAKRKVDDEVTEEEEFVAAQAPTKKYRPEKEEVEAEVVAEAVPPWELAAREVRERFAIAAAQLQQERLDYPTWTATERLVVQSWQE
ncbi:hypothetical protein QFC21_006359 [Naganishia friedmannii]|uniref:Uncharacterized protein n=1 Tax=Naganishia friedmannii TaxID=89922 RepID=A0ACC2V3P5_9TREE|nr:hypothetical protein QFC21_006359 [Naganishia friedmannii]